MALERIGQRVKYAYPWKSLIDLGIDVSGGSDFPIESLDPLLGIKALVEPNINWQENQKINLETAIKIYSSI
jgi:predicted amidohydrolase YtcJ